MFNSNNGYSLSDVAAVTKESNEYMGNGAWWIIILFLFMFSNGNLFGGGNGLLTRSELDFTNLDSSVRGVQQGLADGFYAVNTGMLNGFTGVQRDLCTGFSGVNAAITNVGYQMKDCCCETNRNIDALRYENSKNTCDIVNAIREDGNATRALINANVMQELRDKLADRDRDLMAANFNLSQQAQNQYLINQIKPCAIPAYITCSPYASTTTTSTPAAA